jgi:hypothetical protein
MTIAVAARLEDGESADEGDAFEAAVFKEEPAGSQFG